MSHSYVLTFPFIMKNLRWSPYRIFFSCARTYCYPPTFYHGPLVVMSIASFTLPQSVILRGSQAWDQPKSSLINQDHVFEIFRSIQGLVALPVPCLHVCSDSRSTPKMEGQLKSSFCRSLPTELLIFQSSWSLRMDWILCTMRLAQEQFHCKMAYQFCDMQTDVSVEFFSCSAFWLLPKAESWPRMIGADQMLRHFLLMRCHVR